MTSTEAELADAVRSYIDVNDDVEETELMIRTLVKAQASETGIMIERELLRAQQSNLAYWKSEVKRLANAL